ncbi:MAG: hypothetical protein MZV64_50640 [Ignavibacteriales bacterium]|nr:hypothetical protein [Ignavibacteriales bacterium]
MPEWLMKACDTSFAEKEPQPYEFRAKPVMGKSICNYCRRIYESYACLVNILGSKFLPGKTNYSNYNYCVMLKTEVLHRFNLVL